MSISKTVVISCAGIGSRLGFGLPKAMLEVAGKPLIYHHLDQLQDIADVRVVVGYEAGRLIDLVRRRRNDVTFVFNHEYRQTNALASLCLGAKYANELVVSVDGDLLVRPDDLRRFVASDTELLGFATSRTDEPVTCHVDFSSGAPLVTDFSREPGPYEWTGLAMIAGRRLEMGKGHVYECLLKHLPIAGREIECTEIDTPHDLEYARAWCKTMLPDESNQGSASS